MACLPQYKGVRYNSLEELKAYLQNNNQEINFLEALEKDNAIGNPWSHLGNGQKERIQKQYPQNIEFEIIVGKISSSKLQEIANAEFDEKDYLEFKERENYANKVEKIYGEAARRYVFDTGSEIAKTEGNWLKSLGDKLANDFMSDYLESELGEGLTIKEYAQKLLDKNVKLIDTAQLSLFGETKQQDTKNQYGLYKTNTVKEAVEEFKAWLTGEKHTDKLQDYRKAIIDKVSELKGKQIKTDKENVEFANTLDWIINNPNSVVGTLGETSGKSIASLGFTQSQWDSFSQEKKDNIKKCN